MLHSELSPFEAQSFANMWQLSPTFTAYAVFTIIEIIMKIVKLLNGNPKVYNILQSLFCSGFLLLF